ncbi:trypsin-like peptidase domain-containing protein [Candidatus Uhrbacteria bacterium]|nr:trypsin-like peptidase domain-containing protein [Candidatus Uhrbacteria bacterium]
MKRPAGIVVLVSFLSGAISGGIAGSVAPFALRVTSVPEQQGIRLAELDSEESIVRAVERVSPSVVSVLIAKKSVDRTSDIDDPFQGEEFVPFNEDGFRVGGGSGFFISDDGLIVTNRHVIADKEAEYSVMAHDGQILPAKVIAVDTVLDLGILKVEGSGFPALKLGDSDKLKTGQTVIAIGYALAEFENSVTKGIISGLNRRLIAGDFNDAEILEEAIQTDAAINPGNSGGPLLNLSGEVIGINTAVTDGAQSLGFALPSNAVARAVESVRKHGRIVRPWIGVRYVMLDEEFAKANDVKETQGALILRGSEEGEEAVIKDSPADKAGLQENDVILALNGLPVDEKHPLGTRLGRFAPGESIRLRIRRGEEVFEIELILEERKEL